MFFSVVTSSAEPSVTDDNQENQAETIKFIPTIEYFQKMYGASFEGNDRKAVLCYRNYEPREKLRRLQGELLAVKNGRVAPHVCERVIGKKRLQTNKTFEHWASLMLQWIASKSES